MFSIILRVLQDIGKAIQEAEEDIVSEEAKIKQGARPLLAVYELYPYVDTNVRGFERTALFCCIFVHCRSACLKQYQQVCPPVGSL